MYSFLTFRLADQKAAIYELMEELKYESEEFYEET